MFYFTVFPYFLCCFIPPDCSLVVIHYRLDPGGREETEGLHRAERPTAKQAPPPRGAQPMAALWEVSRGRQEVQNGHPSCQGEGRS